MGKKRKENARVVDAATTSRKELIAGIAAYKHEQQVFVRLLRKRGSFTSDEFDKWFRDREWRRPSFRPKGITEDCFILGIGANGFSVWAEMLDLLQTMVRIGIVDTKSGNGGVVVYVLAKSAGDQ